MNSMPIDLATVDWLYVVILAVFVFFATLIGSLLSFGRRFLTALLSTILFVAAFVFWTYYPHHLPLPIVPALQKAAAPAAPSAAVAPAAPVKPRNPVTDITPPAAPAAPPAAPAAPPAAPPAR
ncbi:MAG TPA: hypothetical protein VMG39_16245 [Pseudolabrys sp.]|nr:hypothetical protein [Pseudolabrys sp.]